MELQFPSNLVWDRTVATVATLRKFVIVCVLIAAYPPMNLGWCNCQVGVDCCSWR